MSAFRKLILFCVLAGIAVCLWFWDSAAPIIHWEGADQLAQESTVTVAIEDPGRGLRQVEVWLKQGEYQEQLVKQSYSTQWLPWKGSPPRYDWTFSAAQFPSIELQEGPFELEVRAEDQANFLFFSRESRRLRSFIFDVSPPRVEVLSGQHYVRQGGSEAVLYRVFEEVESGVQVGDRLFRGYPVSGAETGTRLALFALAWDQVPETPILLWAKDAAGNRARSGFWYRTFPRKFRQRPIQITDQFISKVAPEILSNTDEISEQDTQLATFLEINDRLRKLNNSRIAEISQQSADRLLWEAPFLQLSNSQVESQFADDRTYLYNGKPVDRQTHLGFDLASRARSPIEASNAGQVVFADYLGIYGNCVLIDHGLGLSSLYAHLSSMEVQPGDRVLRGQVIGRTGQTGLAAGDHLHFTLVLQGVQVTPIEWWDENWVRLHVLEKVTSSPDS